MSDTKIVIDKEQILSLIKEYENSTDDFIRGKLSQLKGIVKHATEIQIDQSIESRAEKFLEDNCFYNSITGCYNAVEPMDLVNFTTQQQIIEQLKVKELRKWIIDNSNEINIIDIINKIAELTNG